MSEQQLDQIMEVMDAAFDPSFGEAWTRRQVSDALHLASTHALVAQADGAIPPVTGEAAGFALSRGAADEEEMLLIAVKPGFRRNGVGRALMQRFIEEAGQRGATRLFLEMREGNPAAALYRDFGFKIVGLRPNYYTGGHFGPLNALTMSLITNQHENF